MLPDDYTPGPDVVIIGRGKLVIEHPGNISFRALIDSTLEEYSAANTKGLKSKILYRILNQVRKNSINEIGFVKQDKKSGCWCAIEDAAARICIAQAFRDRLSKQYKSSKENKSIKRKVELGQEITPEEEDQFRDVHDVEPALNLEDAVMAPFQKKQEEAYVVNDADERSAKRVCLAASNEAMLSSCAFPSLTNMDRLRGILNQTASIAFPSKYLFRQESSDSLFDICDKVWPVLSTDNLVQAPMEPLETQYQAAMAPPPSFPVDFAELQQTGPASQMADQFSVMDSFEEQLNYDPIPLATLEFPQQQENDPEEEEEQLEDLEKTWFGLNEVNNAPLADWIGTSFDNLFALSAWAWSSHHSFCHSYICKTTANVESPCILQRKIRIM